MGFSVEQPLGRYLCHVDLLILIQYIGFVLNEMNGTLILKNPVAETISTTVGCVPVCDEAD